MAIYHLVDAETRSHELMKIFDSADVLVVVKSEEATAEETLTKLEEGVRQLIKDIDSRRGDNVAVVENLPRPKGTVEGAMHR